SGASVVLVTSTGLVTTGDTNEDGSFEIHFESADTLVVTLPYQAAYAIEEREGQRNFYAGAAHPDEGESSLVVRLQVVIDGESWYDRELDLAEQSHGFIFRR